MGNIGRLACAAIVIALSVACSLLDSKAPGYLSLEEAEQRVGFEVRLPSYIPSDVQTTYVLELQDSGADSTVIATYYRNDSKRGVLRVMQARSGEVTSIDGAEKLSIGEARVFVGYPSDPNEIVVQAYVDGLFFSVEYLTSLSRPSEELRSEALDVITSILDP